MEVPCGVPKSLWDFAYDDLRSKEKALVDAFETIVTNESRAANADNTVQRERLMSDFIMKKLQTMNDRHWTFKICGSDIKLREVVVRIVKVVQIAREFVAPAANIDPIHIGFPLAGVCILLSVSTIRKE